MAVRIRMTRMGRRHRPFFRINAIDGRSPRDGKILEKLGHLDPLIKDPDKRLVLNKERVIYWLSQGAVPSETVSEILLKQGIPNKAAEQRLARRARARAIARTQGKHFTKADRILAEKRAKEEKAAAEAAAKAAEEEAKAKAEAEAKAAETEQAETAKDEGGSGE